MAERHFTKLAAEIVRAAAGLDDSEPVTLECGAASIRDMVMAAKRETDELRSELAQAQERIQKMGAVVEAAEEIGRHFCQEPTTPEGMLRSLFKEQLAPASENALHLAEMYFERLIDALAALDSGEET